MEPVVAFPLALSGMFSLAQKASSLAVMSPAELPRAYLDTHYVPA